jgi:tetratricopeptide (TPR) repeat protein
MIGENTGLRTFSFSNRPMSSPPDVLKDHSNPLEYYRVFWTKLNRPDTTSKKQYSEEKSREVKRLVKINRALTFSAIIIISLFFCGCSHDVSFYRKTGDVYYKNGAYAKAEAEYQKVLKHYPNDSEAHFKLGVIYYKKGFIEKSLLEFLEVTSIDPKYGKAYYNLGSIFSLRGPYYDAQKATFCFKKYLELEPANSNRDKIELWLSKYGTK